MMSENLLSHLTALLDQAAVAEGASHHANSGTHLLRHHAPTELNATVYRPLLCLILQGAKQVGSSTRTLTVGAGQSLIVSHTLPVVSRITEASTEAPYTALVFPLDLDLLRSLAPSVSPALNVQSADPFSICLCDTDPGLEDALHRFFLQCEEGETRQLLAPITSREIHARVLIGEHARVLQRLLWHESSASRIHLATRDIQANLSETIVVGDLAARIGMSNSAFFEQFKAVTGTSPLQYQKDLRLLKARDDLRTSRAKISEVAFAVGYESSAQFSREYARKFGKSPRQDRELAPAD
ncbi:AraC family transcriptional regulator [Ruegeria sp. B32]|uniref:AraC family transcriptional regulator n=1 Tax=Ruegeria sp. B32 TaxID=2867020 RepID=UPI0021A68439|nr:AraC family transcriptional regulator [Ruegeria sp. B32]UWR09572.1 AraC family transcriptional regulator [Ruegeria sp. B32]